MENLSSGVIFDRGERVNVFGGEAYLNMMVPFADPSGCSIGNVTFAPGVRNDWHIHHGWQFLFVTGGEGYYQEWGRPARRLHPGDVVRVPPGVKHWHGAVSDNWFTHIGMIVNETEPTTGCEKLTDEAYRHCEEGI